MSDQRDETVRLTEAQRKLVRDNVGLVGVHLRRFMPGLAAPRRDREWDDLFQEGCLGLIKAAAGYAPQRGIPFAAYALARIHAAVSAALATRFTSVRLPRPRRPVSDDPHDSPTTRPRDPQRPAVHQFTDGTDIPARDPRPCGIDPHAADETIGDRIRGKYERAVRAAGERLARRGTTRGDRDALVHVLIEDRLLIPQPESRTALRQIARDTRSSFARVAKCEKQLGKAVCETLEEDPEFRELQRRAKSSPHGGDLPVDDEMERSLANTGARAFAARLQAADDDTRAQLLYALMQQAGVDQVALALEHTRDLSPERRERLLRAVDA